MSATHIQMPGVQAPGVRCLSATAVKPAGYPLPAINGPAGFSYCPDGQIAAFSTGHSVGSEGVEAGDTLIFSWEPFYYGNDGVAYCSSGVYAGAPAGDHTGLFVRWLGDGYMLTVEGNTSQSSWDDGGAVLERSDRYAGQICCYARHAALGTGGTPPQTLWEFLMTNDELIAKLDRMEQRIQAVYWHLGNFEPSDAMWNETVAQIVRRVEQRTQDVYWHLGNFAPSDEMWDETVASIVRRVETNTQP